MNRKIAKLLQISNIIQEKETLDLRNANLMRATVTGNAKKLRSEYQIINAIPGDDLLRFVGADRKWRIWADRQLEIYSIQEARAAEIEEKQKIIALKAFGRSSALRNISKRRK